MWCDNLAPLFLMMMDNVQQNKHRQLKAKCSYNSKTQKLLPAIFLYNVASRGINAVSSLSSLIACGFLHELN